MKQQTLLCMALALCTSVAMAGDIEITGKQKADILAYADPITDGLLAGLNENNYAKYSKDFGPVMKQTATPQSFAALHTRFMAKIGKYVSRTNPRIVRHKAFFIVVYAAKFEKEDPVTVRVVFPAAGNHYVTGLWFDSPKLRQP